jgi:UDP-N-acetylglucosamine--N-acetylmuramyl-(pentapeptide) pyrophosphoryl-undecaprenol N-acetylglucosamine transferase
VSRAGASTLWELSASGVPALYIPYPYAAANHQYFNARFLVDKKYSFVKDEKFLRESDLFDALSSDISAMSRGLKEITDPNGAKEIVDKILSTIVS